MDVLVFLIEHRGELVTREQIGERIWGGSVYLDTDNSINAAIRKIRQVLKKTKPKRQPRFILTIPGRGYRFMVPPSAMGEEVPNRAAFRSSAIETRPFSESVSEKAARRWPIWAGIAVVLVAILWAGRQWSRTPFGPQP